MKPYPTEQAARAAARVFTRAAAGKFRYDPVMSPREQFFIAIIRVADNTLTGFVN